MDRFLLSTPFYTSGKKQNKRTLSLLTNEFGCNPLTWQNVHWSSVVCVHRHTCMPTPCVNTLRKRKALLSICRAFNDAHRCQAEFNSWGECSLIYASTLWLCSVCAFFDCGFGWGIGLDWGQAGDVCDCLSFDGVLGSFVSKQPLTLSLTVFKSRSVSRCNKLLREISAAVQFTSTSTRTWLPFSYACSKCNWWWIQIKLRYGKQRCVLLIYNKTVSSVPKNVSSSRIQVEVLVWMQNIGPGPQIRE